MVEHIVAVFLLLKQFANTKYFKIKRYHSQRNNDAFVRVSLLIIVKSVYTSRFNFIAPKLLPD